MLQRLPALAGAGSISRKAAITRVELHALLANCGTGLVGPCDCALLSFALPVAVVDAAKSPRLRWPICAACPSAVYHLDRGKTLQDGTKAGISPDKPLLDTD
ncbi:hypothetical protein [Stenotrophomonas rhizophila]|uniref:hypothetical protein n=1 Tax=Stenotrophomonas rhizophila TaxID=216778 RepID=UPI001E46216E|nr:hypothetical protein [Stenotrophomonas rhizophila]MCC7635353.1 hypothetical protein [Stenotrophomonas rhizophila]MCC7664418.1 hypothetical protein [Stenotrophomonas rhizophila]